MDEKLIECAKIFAKAIEDMRATGLEDDRIRSCTLYAVCAGVPASVHEDDAPFYDICDLLLAHRLDNAHCLATVQMLFCKMVVALGLTEAQARDMISAGFRIESGDLEERVWN